MGVRRVLRAQRGKCTLVVFAKFFLQVCFVIDEVCWLVNKKIVQGCPTEVGVGQVLVGWWDPSTVNMVEAEKGCVKNKQGTAVADAVWRGPPVLAAHAWLAPSQENVGTHGKRANRHVRVLREVSVWREQRRTRSIPSCRGMLSTTVRTRW